MHSKVFDAHCDTLDKWINGIENCSFSFAQAAEYERFVEGMAVWIDGAKIKAPFLYTKKCIGILEKRRGNIPLIKKRDDLFKSGTGILLCVEGGEAIEGSLLKLESLYSMGVRLLTLTWNYKNAIGTPAITGECGGLSSFGREVIHKMEALCMAIDVSHLSEQGFYDVISVATKPIIASHSAAKALCAHPRNITDAQFQALVENGGVIGINFYPDFLGGNSIDDILRHILHFLSLGGENHIGLGSDFDGVDVLPKGMESTRDLSRIAEALLRANLKEEIVEKIMYGNMERFFYKILPVS